MKRTLLFAILLFALSVSMDAQTNVSLQINHLLGDENFAMNMASENNMGHSFKVTRLQYYVSEISIVHDGGTETPIEDLYLLVNANEPLEVDLGSHDITTVEALNFHIGVDEDHNHLDPAAYPAGHPLAPTFPSMHWGWAAGYRFIALEGDGGANFNQEFQLHALGDKNYYKTEIPMLAIAENGEINLSIDADYNRALENIPVNSGVIVHGEEDEAATTIENFRFVVFSPSEGFTPTFDREQLKSFSVFPNPATNGVSNVIFETLNNGEFQLMVTDLLGRTVQVFDIHASAGQLELNITEPGMYFVNMVKEGKVVAVEKLIAKK